MPMLDHLDKTPASQLTSNVAVILDSSQAAMHDVREHCLSRLMNSQSQFPAHNRPFKCRNSSGRWNTGVISQAQERGCQLKLPIELSTVNPPHRQN